MNAAARLGAAGILAAVVLLGLPWPAGADDRAELESAAMTTGAARVGLDEAAALGSGAASLGGSLRVYLEGPDGSSGIVFGARPDRDHFSRLPADAAGGVGAVLRGEPFASAVVWLAFSARNDAGGDDWALVADGSGFAPSAMVIVAEDGSRAYYGGAALDRRRVDTGRVDLSAYSVELPRGRSRAVYVRLERSEALGGSLELWPKPVLKARVGAVSAFSSALAGFAVAACAAYALAAVSASSPGVGAANGTRTRISGGAAAPRFRMPLGLAYPALACAAILYGRHGGGVSALLGGIGTGRYLASVALAAAALASEAAIAIPRAAGQGSVGLAVDRASAARAALPRLAFAAVAGAFAFSTRSIFHSFVLPAGLALHVGCSTIAEAAAAVRRARASIEESERRSSKLELEARGGRDFLTATAAALRGPLHGLIGILENLEAAMPEPPAVSRTALSDLSLARAEAARLENLVSNILSYSGMGPSRLEPEDFDLASVARSAAGLLRVALSGRGVRIDVESPIIEVRSDIGIAHRLLYTAMNRAARTGGAKAVRVEARSDDRVVVVAVTDDGLDSPAPDMETAVLARLASLLGGSFEYRRTFGRNAHVIELPRSAPIVVEEARAAEARSRLPEGIAPPDFWSAEGGGSARAAGRVLVAGNEPVALIATRRRLEASSWIVDVTVSARDALDRVLGGEPYDIVIIDSTMPEMSGFDFCEAVRAIRGPESVPVIVLTEAGRADEIERAFESGANDYIARPASGVELAARVKTHVDLSSSIRRELEQAARMAELDKYRTLAMLSAGVAHEINTPNNAVLRNVPMLKEIWSALGGVVDRLNREEGGFSVRGFGYEDLKREIPDMLNDLYMGAQDIKKIVEGLKDYARAPSDSPDLPLVDANECIRYAVRLLKHTIAVSTGRFELRLAEGLPPVRADRLKLTQVAVNVLENAMQSLPDGKGGVKAETFVDPGRDGRAAVVVRVSDDGVGMSPETLARVFEPFFTTKRDRGGSGLGLAVVSGIVRDLGGSIDLASVPGAGTTATIRLPAAVGRAPAGPGSATEGDHGSGYGK